MSTAELGGSIYQPPDETVEFFRGKGAIEITDRWWELWAEEHSRAFTVAGVNDRLLLQQLYGSLDDVIANGGTYQAWRAAVLDDLKSAVARGVAPASILRDHRLRIIYGTNLRMARAAGKWKRIQANKDIRPYLMYVATMDSRTRPLHAAWHGTILPVDHIWWDTHFPPCGWNCRCTVIQLDEADIEQRGLKVSPDAPNDGPEQQFVTGYGEIKRVPAGIDPGFEYNVGKEHMRGLAPVFVDRELSEPRLVSAEKPPPPPPATKTDQTELLPQDLPGEDVAHAFFSLFDGLRNDAGLFVEKAGFPIIIDRRMVTGAAGFLKTTKFGRGRYARLAARTIIEPDEIWSFWDPSTRKMTRSYLKTFLVDGEETPIFVAMELNADGWAGRTWFAPKDGKSAAAKRQYMDKRRRGALHYRRGDDQ